MHEKIVMIDNSLLLTNLVNKYFSPIYVVPSDSWSYSRHILDSHYVGQNLTVVFWYPIDNLEVQLSEAYVSHNFKHKLPSNDSRVQLVKNRMAIEVKIYFLPVSQSDVGEYKIVGNISPIEPNEYAINGTLETIVSLNLVSKFKRVLL